MIGEEWATIQSREKSNTLRPIYRPFNDDEQIRIQNTLDQSIEPEYIQFRPSPQGSVAYVEGWKALSLANETFGFNGWSSEILHLNPDFVDISSDGRVSLGISCMVRIHLRDGTFHDDIGYGIAENHKTKGGAWEKARKEAVTDAMKRALRMFGSRLGNCAYDKAFLRQVKNGPPKRALVTNNNNTGGNMNNPTNNHNRADTIPLSKQQTPSDYAPSWKHPKTAPTETIITAPTAPVRGINHSATTSIPPTTNTTSATSEADSEPVVTEELDAGIASSIDYNFALESGGSNSRQSSSSRPYHRPNQPYNKAPYHMMMGTKKAPGDGFQFSTISLPSQSYQQSGPNIVTSTTTSTTTTTDNNNKNNK